MPFVSPSVHDGIPPPEEALQLAHAADLVRDACTALQLSQRVSACAQLLLQRFYTQVSLRAHATVWAAGAVILLSTKLADEPRRLRHVANVLYDRLLDRQSVTDDVLLDGKTFRRPLDFYGAQGYDWKISLIETERHVMKELGFRLSVELPHNFVLVFVNTLREKAACPNWTEDGVDEFRKLLQAAWNYANDVLLLRLCVLEEPEFIACACIALATKKCAVEFPRDWQIVFGCEVDVCDRIANEIVRLYEMPPLRGKFVDHSRCHVFDAFCKRKDTNAFNEVPPPQGGVVQKPKQEKRKRKRPRFEDAVGSVS